MSRVVLCPSTFIRSKLMVKYAMVTFCPNVLQISTIWKEAESSPRVSKLDLNVISFKNGIIMHSSSRIILQSSEWS